MSEMEKTMAGNPVENDGVETGAAAAVEEPIVAECDCKNEAEPNRPKNPKRKNPPRIRAMATPISPRPLKRPSCVSATARF